MNGLEKSCFNNLIKMDSRLLALIEFDKALICDGTVPNLVGTPNKKPSIKRGYSYLKKKFK